MYNDEEMERQLEEIINEIFTTSEFRDLIDLIINDAYDFQEIVPPQGEPLHVTPTFDSFLYPVCDSKEECSICLVDFETNDSVTLLKCNHCFHIKCIEEWSTIKAECPNCREKI